MEKKAAMSLRGSGDQNAARRRLLAEFTKLERELAAAKSTSARISEMLDKHPQLFGVLPADHLAQVRATLVDIERIWGEIVDALAALGRS